MHFPEFWYGISADKLPYLKKLEQQLLTSSEFASLAALIKSADYHSPVTDRGFCATETRSHILKARNVGGKITQSGFRRNTH